MAINKSLLSLDLGVNKKSLNRNVIGLRGAKFLALILLRNKVLKQLYL